MVGRRFSRQSTSEGSCVREALPYTRPQAEALNARFDIDENISLNEFPVTHETATSNLC
jgi:hypothetical protein